jgi:hypothetical protein
LEAVNALVVSVKVAAVEPEDTTTLAGTVATAVLLLESVTVAPPEGAALAKVIVPVAVVPPMIRLVLNVRFMVGRKTTSTQ